MLADSSAWIAFLRGENAALSRMGPLLRQGKLVMAGPVYAEIVSGTATPAAFNNLRRLLEPLTWLPQPDRAWERIAELRFNLSRQGFQATVLDLMIALTAGDAGCDLLTRDRDFDRIRLLVPLEVVLF